MAPKKAAKAKKNDGPVEDEVTILKRKVSEREVEIVELDEKLRVLEDKSQELSGGIGKIRVDAVERGERLNDIIIYLNGQVKLKAERSALLEVELESLNSEKTESSEALTKELEDLKHSYKFILEDLRLQLDNAQVQLRDLNEFTVTKAALEQETKSLKEQLEREKKDHQESISDVERQTLQERERLKKEMAVRIEETKREMIKQAHEQLHLKTKNTIIENEHLSRELIVHIRQTETLLTKNEKLVEEYTKMHRYLLLAKELEEDLRRRNATYQKTMRTLVFKLREKFLANKMERKMEEKELKQLIGRNEALKSDVQGEKKQLDKLREIIEQRTAAAEEFGPAEEAMKFLYTCIEDLEIERLLKERTDGCTGQEAGDDTLPSLPRSLNLLSLQQRKSFLKHLIRTAIQLRAASRNFESMDQGDKDELALSHFIWTEPPSKQKTQPMVSVEDILSMPFGAMELEDPSILSDPVWVRPTCASAQTDAKDVESTPTELF